MMALVIPNGYEYLSNEFSVMGHIEQITLYVKPTKKTIKLCPCCKKRKRKYVSQYVFIDLRKKMGREINLMPVCDNCFELEIFPEIWTNIHGGTF